LGFSKDGKEHLAQCPMGVGTGRKIRRRGDRGYFFKKNPKKSHRKKASQMLETKLEKGVRFRRKTQKFIQRRGRGAGAGNKPQKRGGTWGLRWTGGKGGRGKEIVPTSDCGQGGDKYWGWNKKKFLEELLRLTGVVWGAPGGEKGFRTYRRAPDLGKRRGAEPRATKASTWRDAAVGKTRGGE